MLENIAVKFFSDAAVRLVTSEAEKVLGSNQGVEGLPEVKISTFLGHRYQHWSQYVAGAGALAGLITGVVGYMASQNPLTVLGAALFVTNTVSLYNLTRFVPMRSLEGYVSALTRRVKKLGEHIIDYKEANKDFEKFNRTFGDQLKETKGLLAEKEKAFSKKVEELQALSKRLAATDKKLADVEKLYGNLKKVASEVTVKVAQYNQENMQMYQNIDTLAGKVKEVKAMEEEFKRGFSQVDIQNKEFVEQNKELLDMMSDLRYQVTALQKLHDAMRKERERLEKQVDHLAKIQEKATKEAADVKEAGKEAAKAAEAFEKVADKVEELDKGTKEVDQGIEEAKKRAHRIEELMRKRKAKKAKKDKHQVANAA